MIFIRTDILNPYNPKIVSQDNYSTLIKFLIKYFPSGFDRPVDISVNGFVIEVDMYDIELNDEDVIVILDRSALPVGLIGGWFITALANLAISVTLSYVANKLFTPDEPEEQAKPSSVYTIATGQNTAKYGSPIPIVYGKVRMYPSMIVNPYYKIEDNIEYLYHIMCIGQGQYTTDSVMIGEDTITTPGDLQYKLMNKDTFYNIPANAYGIHITRTLSSPSNLELKEGVLTERYNIKQGTHTVEFDYHYPNGIYATNSVGEYIWGTAAFSYFIHSSTGVLLYTGRRQDFGISADPIQWSVSNYVGAWTVDGTITISFQQDVTADDPGYSEKNYVKRVKEIYPNKDFTQLYGDITLLACKIKATNAVSSAGQVKVNGYFERTDVGNSMEEVLTDIYTNTNYGGALDVNDLDFPVTDAVVDCAYESNQTVFDAMRKPALAQGYSVFLAGMDVIMKKDGVNTVTSGMYNEMNILRDSLKVQYLFKEDSPSYDGYEVSYIEGDGWIPRTSTYPTNSIRPQKVDLFGVVDWGGEPYHTFDMTVTSPVQVEFLVEGGTINNDDNGDGTWHVWSDDSVTMVRFDVSEDTVTAIVIHNSKTLTTGLDMFGGLYNVKTIELGGLDTSNMTTMDGMFDSCHVLESLDCSSFDTSKVTDMSHMFSQCRVATSINVSSFDTRLVWDMRWMFYGCEELREINLTNFQTPSLTICKDMFGHCGWLTSLNLLSFDFSQVTDMLYMFEYTTRLVCLTNIDSAGVSVVDHMFLGANAMESPDSSERALISTPPGLDWVNPGSCPA